jgi:hypothetical protein
MTIFNKVVRVAKKWQSIIVEYFIAFVCSALAIYINSKDTSCPQLSTKYTNLLSLVGFVFYCIASYFLICKLTKFKNKVINVIFRIILIAFLVLVFAIVCYRLLS